MESAMGHEDAPRRPVVATAMSPGPMFLVSAIAAGATVLSGGIPPRYWLPAQLLGSTAALIAALTVIATGTTWDWHSTITLGGELLHLRIDSLSALFIALLGVVGGLGAIYASTYGAENDHPR